MNMSVYLIPDIHPKERDRQQAIEDSQVMSLVKSKTFSPILDVVREELRVGAVAISIVYKESAYFLAAAGFDTGVYRRATSLCAHAILHPDDLIVVSDTRVDARFSGNPLVEDAGGVGFYAAVQLRDQNDLPLGTVCVFDSAPRAGLTPQEVACLRQISNAITALIQCHAQASEGVVQAA